MSTIVSCTTPVLCGGSVASGAGPNNKKIYSKTRNHFIYWSRVHDVRCPCVLWWHCTTVGCCSCFVADAASSIQTHDTSCWLALFQREVTITRPYLWNLGRHHMITTYLRSTHCAIEQRSCHLVSSLLISPSEGRLSPAPAEISHSVSTYQPLPRRKSTSKHASSRLLHTALRLQVIPTPSTYLMRTWRLVRRLPPARICSTPLRAPSLNLVELRPEPRPRTFVVFSEISQQPLFPPKI